MSSANTASSVAISFSLIAMIASMPAARGAGGSSGGHGSASSHATSGGAATGGITNPSSAVPTGSGNSLTSQSSAATGGINDSDTAVPTGPGDQLNGLITGQNGASGQVATGGTNERSIGGSLGTGVNPYTGVSVGQPLQPNDLGFSGNGTKQ